MSPAQQTDMQATLTGGVVTRRGADVLGPVDLQLAPHGFTIVLGPNGAGKTTLLKVLHGVERLSKGKLRWSASDKEVREGQAYVFQTPVMLRRSVWANLAYPLQIQGTPRADIGPRVTEWAQRIGLGDALDRPAPQLSGGEKQKLALGRALIRDPKLLFLDEPCASLDATSTREIEALLLDAHRAGTRIVMSTHNLGQAKRLAGDVIFMLNGRIHEHRVAPDIFSAPRSDQTRAFFDGEIVE